MYFQHLIICKLEKTCFKAWCDYVREWQEENGIFRYYKRKLKDIDIPIFIDGRLTAEQMQIFCVTPKYISKYKEHLFDDSEVEDAPCTMKQTSHSAAMDCISYSWIFY